MPTKRKRSTTGALRRKVGAAPAPEGAQGQPGATMPLPALGDASEQAEGAPEPPAAAPDVPDEPPAQPPAREAEGALEEDAEEDEHPKKGRKGRRARKRKERARKRDGRTPRQRRLRRLRIAIVVLLALCLVAVCALAGAFAHFRWQAYDDHADMLGTWYISGTDTAIEVTEDTIELTPDVAYRYQIDPEAKTISFRFGNLSGEGHYRFSLDRQHLAIIDGTFTWEESLSIDASWLIQALWDHLAEVPNDLSHGTYYNVTLLSRNAADDSAVSAAVVSTSEGPRVVWSAPDAQAPEEGDASGASSGTQEPSDVESLVDSINDLPQDG